MTLQREGWIDDRPYAVIRDPDTGASEKFVCLKCGLETIPDADAFGDHLCHKTKKNGS